MSDRDDNEILTLVTREIEALHDFIAAWFRGELENSEQVFNEGFRDRLHDQIVNIQPGGQTLTSADLLQPIKAAHGVNPDFQISISDVAVRFVDHGRSLILATYVEHQSGARNTTPSRNDRVSTVLFQWPDDAQRPLWMHIHETARPLN
ncbi:MAG: hypothetical protein ACR2PA_03820 [Hyphomicrobiaceae bacterium]